MTALTPEQIHTFQKDGYLRIGKLLGDDLIETLRQEYDREFSLARENNRFRNLAISDTDNLEDKKSAPTQMLQIMQMCERNMHFRKLIYHDEILDIAESLIGPNIQLFHDQALFKPALNGDAVFWHQDNAYWQCIPANLVSCWLTLDDVDVSNGAMHVIPGSHLQAHAHEKSAKTGALLDYGNAVEESLARVIDLPAGGVMFHHCQTLHFTPPNTTNRQRRAFAIHFMTPGTRSARTGDHLKVSFTRPMLRMRL
ncbi:MAG: phytanoyl-CoA dioxygenase family protein [bacterium]|jgi:phytanoyl-CoA hydroxylase|nr:phytanoyl-CoA dioxygenase family protein [bacterium]